MRKIAEGGTQDDKRYLHGCQPRLVHQSPGIYPQGDVRSRVTSNGKALAFESYRHLYHKGRDATKANIVLMQSSVLSPKAASKVADIEARLNEWKFDQ